MNVPEILAQLAQWEHHLEGHARYILQVAGACPPGGNFAWDQLLTQYAAGPQDPPLTRLEEVQRSAQSRGASISEVRRCVMGMCTQAKGELDRILAPVPIGAAGMVVAVGAGTGHLELEGRVATLRARLTKLPDDAASTHAAAVCPPKAAVAASVNSVFANATATAKLAPWANVKFDPAKVYECHSCGAPQQEALDFLCRYCRSPMTKS